MFAIETNEAYHRRRAAAERATADAALDPLARDLHRELATMHDARAKSPPVRVPD